MVSSLIILLSLLLIGFFVIICVQRLEIYELRHEMHELKRKDDNNFWGRR